MANGMCSKIMGRNVDLVFNDDLTNECTAALSTWVINGVDFFKYEYGIDLKQPMLFYTIKKRYYFLLV